MRCAKCPERCWECSRAVAATTSRECSRYPKDPLQACETIAQGVPRAMDVGEIDGRAFVGIASVGFDSDANRIANEAPSRLGNLVYVYGALRALIAWRPARFEIEIDPRGRAHQRLRAYTVGACNSQAYGGGMVRAPDALLDDGLLDVIVLENVSKWAFVTKVLPKVFSGEHDPRAARAGLARPRSGHRR